MRKAIPNCEIRAADHCAARVGSITAEPNDVLESQRVIGV
jgi:hypothetical protein